MSNNIPDISQLNAIVKETIDALEEGKAKIFEISEQAQNEYKELKAKLHLIQEKVQHIIKETELLEKKELERRKKLMLVSKNFNIYSEDDIKGAYEATKDLQIKLALKREQERQLILQRTDLEHQIIKIKDIIERSEYLTSHVAVAMEYLTGALFNIGNTLEDLQKKEILGVRVITAQEEERQRISRDIHDGPAQSLTNILIKCEICEKLFDIDLERAKEEIKDLKNLARDSLKELREIIFDLRPMSLDDLGLVPTLEQYTAKFQRDTQINVKLNLYSNEVEIDPVIEVAAFRIIQEALNNIKKHSQGTKCSIELSIENNKLVGTIKDNGIGFDLEEANKPKQNLKYDSGFGIYSMRQRAELLKGKVNIETEQGKGTAVKFEIPLCVGDNAIETEEE
ncbi:MAG TPA: sensor histidine kinase [Clostridiales bacterium]|nr:sensor histidine kinase [Clostridiales bacterium]